ncbi:hypothetical protein KAF25_006693 [Fusarium avenaceum]|uniref:RNA ligase domain-containing protein n=1 Tax=Fusarium avenaceum TaxID=40199 RepID=A0A9P7KVM0_9HYPO|nr:hypothetical protein KAF25_006693 [Fusarium avenaceum]
MPRKLVTVRQISAITPIQGADRIVKATVDGWICVVSNIFKPGDRGVYFEIDSLLPGSDPRFAFLALKTAGADEPTCPSDIRVRTMKIRGAVSQGLLMPLTDFPEIVSKLDGGISNEQGDVGFEDILNVRKYEKPAVPLSQDSASATPLPDFPVFIPRTDQERVQNLPDIFSTHGSEVFQESTKMDGSSMTVFYLNNSSPYYETLPDEIRDIGVGVCSRNRILIENHPRSPSLFYTTARVLKLHETLAKIRRNIAVQGELCGSSFQSNFEGFSSGTHNFSSLPCMILMSSNICHAERYMRRGRHDLASNMSQSTDINL